MASSNYSDFVSFKWEDDPADIFAQLALEYGELLQSFVYNIVGQWAPVVEEWMVQNAPWEDRTGAARAGLTAKAHLVVNKFVVMRLSHAVYYGTYLEGTNPKTNQPMNNAGQWSIIEPALDEFGPLIWNSMRSEMGI